MQGSTAEVPVWVNGLQRWVTGIDRRTTCDEVINTLLRSDPAQSQPPPGRVVGGAGWIQQQQHHVAPPEDLHHRYAIVERWRKVERPLDGRSRILKVWSAWGDAQRDVKLALRRRVAGTTAPAVGSDSTTTPLSTLTKETFRRRRHHHLVGRESSAKTIHPRRLYSRACGGEEWDGVGDGRVGWEEGEEEERPPGEQRKFTETMEKLMKLILAQGETIQAQLKKLREREDQIDHFEHELHRLRVQSHGSNYLLDTYLKGVDVGLDEGEGQEGSRGGEDSGVVTEGGSGDGGDPSPPDGDPEGRLREGAEDLQPQIEAWEKILKVNKKLERTEECLVKLQAKLRQHEVAKARGEEEEAREVERIRAEVERATLQSREVERELRRNEQALARADERLRVRHEVLEGLQRDLEALDGRRQEEPRGRPAPGYGVPPQPGVECCDKVRKLPADKDPHDTDSNSDTGLSSLHSSGEEGYVLDTLV